jgi:hypothetical protein
MRAVGFTMFAADVDIYDRRRNNQGAKCLHRSSQDSCSNEEEKGKERLRERKEKKGRERYIERERGDLRKGRESERGRQRGRQRGRETKRTREGEERRLKERDREMKREGEREDKEKS